MVHESGHHYCVLRAVRTDSCLTGFQVNTANTASLSPGLSSSQSQPLTAGCWFLVAAVTREIAWSTSGL